MSATISGIDDSLISVPSWTAAWPGRSPPQALREAMDGLLDSDQQAGRAAHEA